jgi:hypothetical protein
MLGNLIAAVKYLVLVVPNNIEMTYMNGYIILLVETKVLI